MKIIKSKVFKIILILFIVGLILGIVAFFITDKLDKSSISINLNNYIDNIKNNDVSYSNALINTITQNLEYLSIIWISGIIFIFIIIVPLLIVFKGILTSFTIFNIINVFNFKGVLYALIMMFPCTIINLIILLLMSYYSIHFSLKCYKAIRYNKYINLKDFIKNYVYIYIILSFISIVNSFIEIYFVSNILKFVV